MAMVAWMVAGVQTQYEHLKSSFPPEDFDILGIETRPYVQGGWLERLPLPHKPRGTIRSVATLLPLLWARPLDAVWSQMSVQLLPFVLTRAAMQGIPLFFAVDSTPALYATFRGHYAHQTKLTSVKGRASVALHRLFYHRCTGLLPWSRWVANSMIHDYGVPAERVHVVHPGVDVERWRPSVEPGRNARPQLMFVGGDFARKGGPLLLDVYRAHFRDTCDLHLVTRADIQEEAGVRVYRDFGPDDDRLLRLYQRCDALVLPTLADLFSMASIEAMACGLPVIVSAVGGIPEIVEDGMTGRLIPPGDRAALVVAIRSLVEDAERRRKWGAAAREVAVERFDTKAQARRVAGLIGDAVAKRSAGRAVPSDR
jgi:glycosyltransferase involved in cell wall biosynthesis